MGTFGLIGFIGRFGLLTVAVFRAATALKYAQTTRQSVCLAALALLVAINMIDLLPNASATPWLWLLVGALLGRAEAMYAVGRRRKKLTSAELSPSRIGR